LRGNLQRRKASNDLVGKEGGEMKMSEDYLEARRRDARIVERKLREWGLPLTMENIRRVVRVLWGGVPSGRDILTMYDIIARRQERSDMSKKCLCEAEMEYLGHAYYIAVWICHKCERLAVFKNGRIFWYVREEKKKGVK